jgi:hypothetical protein
LQAYLDQYRETVSNSAEHDAKRVWLEHLVTDAREYYAAFGWVAEVTIAKCDPPTSRRRAERITQSALDCLHILLGAAYSRHMRVGGPQFRTDRRGLITLSPDGAAEVSTSASWLSHNLGDRWWEWVSREGGGALIALMGVAIEAGHDLPHPAPLAQRFLDAARWFGEATKDDFAASRLIKHVTAIERTLTTKKEVDISKTLATRGAALIFTPQVDDLDNHRSRFKKIYALRSKLVHGSRSPTEPGLGAGIRDAEDLARSVLLRSLQFFQHRGLQDRHIASGYLDEAYSKLVAWVNGRPPSPTEPVGNVVEGC